MTLEADLGCYLAGSDVLTTKSLPLSSQRAIVESCNVGLCRQACDSKLKVNVSEETSSPRDCVDSLVRMQVQSVNNIALRGGGRGR